MKKLYELYKCNNNLLIDDDDDDDDDDDNNNNNNNNKQHSQNKVNFTLLWQRIFLWKQKVEVIGSLESNSISTDNV